MPKLRLALALISAIALGPTPLHAQSIIGTASAIDGDSIDITGQQVRLHGIDTPELRQTCLRDGASWPCGTEARDLLASMLTSGDVRCEGELPTASGILVARCEAGGTDLGEAMVASGFATVIGAGEADYADMVARVQARKIGIWAGTFEAPEIWRAAHREPEARTASTRRTATPGTSRKVYRDMLGCAIKGNYSRRLREYIYFLPGMKYYDGTRPEMIFCTEAEAQAAGFRRSRGG